MLYYSPSEGFYSSAIHGKNIPIDACEITKERYLELLAAQSEGRSILPNADGSPGIFDPPGPTDEQLAEKERATRDRALLLTDPMIARHRDELEAERPTTLTAEQYKQLQSYRQDLRDWPESEHFPVIEHRPEQPAWLSELIQ